MPNNPSSIFLLIRTAKLIKQQLKNEIDEGENHIPYELLSHIGKKGKSLKELTILMQCSKQEISRIVQRSVENGWVEVIKSEEDARSKIVIFSTKGFKSLEYGLKKYQEIEKEWEKLIGKDDISILRDILIKLENILSLNIKE